MVRPETKYGDKSGCNNGATEHDPGTCSKFGPACWNLMDFVTLRRLKYTVQTRVPCGVQSQQLAIKTLSAYILYLEDKSIDASIEILLSVLHDQHDNLCALGTLYFIFDQSGHRSKSQEISEKIIHLQSDKQLQQQAKYEEAFLYLLVGPKGSAAAQTILQDLHAEAPDDTQVLLDIILCMVRQIDMKSNDNPCVTVDYLNILGRYVDLALMLIPEEPVLYSRVLHMILAGRTSPIGKGWIKKFLKSHHNLKPEMCIERARSSLHMDGRDIGIYTNIIRYYDRSLNFEAAYNVAKEAALNFPNDKFFVARKASYHLEKAKQEFKISKIIDKPALDTAISLFKTLFSEEEWYFRYKIAMQLGTAYYIEGNPQLAYKYYKISLDLFNAEYQESLRISQIYFNWCFILVLCNEAHGNNVNFSHMRNALRIQKHDTRQPNFRSLPIIFRKALDENPDSIFYMLCNGYLELETGKIPIKDNYFTKALSKQRDYDTLLGMAECSLAQDKDKEALGWLEEAGKMSLKEKDVACEEHATLLSENIYRRGKKNESCTGTEIQQSHLEDQSEKMYRKENKQPQTTFKSSVGVQYAKCAPGKHDIHTTRRFDTRDGRREKHQGHSHDTQNSPLRYIHSLNPQSESLDTIGSPGKTKNAYTSLKMKHRTPILLDPSARNKENMDFGRCNREGIPKLQGRSESGKSEEESLMNSNQFAMKPQNKESLLTNELESIHQCSVSPQLSISTANHAYPEKRNICTISMSYNAKPISCANFDKESQSLSDVKVVLDQETPGTGMIYKSVQRPFIEKMRNKTVRTQPKLLNRVNPGDQPANCDTLNWEFESGCKSHKHIAAERTLAGADTLYAPSGVLGVEKDTDDMLCYVDAFFSGDERTRTRKIDNDIQDEEFRNKSAGSSLLYVVTPPSR